MFKNEYQGGPFVEIFSSQGKDPVAKWKLYGSPAVQKVFDKEVKSYVYILEGSGQRNKMQLPKDSKQTLGLIQRFLVLQLCVPVGQDFSTELLITDLGNIKRRLYLSTIHKELSATPLHAKIPLRIIKRKIWNNICIDMVSFANAAFKGAGFQSLDRIVVSANCKLRKIFTMKLQPQDNDMYSLQCFTDGPTDVIPKSCQLGIDVDQVTQLLNAVKLREGELRFGSQTLTSTDLDQQTNRGTASARTIRNQNISHIAFGSKVLGPPPTSVRKIGTTGSKDLSGLMDNKMTRSSYQLRCNKEDISERLIGRSERQASSRPEPVNQINQESISFTKQTSEAVILVMKVELCSLSGYKIYPGHGKQYARIDGKVFQFLNSKCESALRNPRQTHWTVLYRRKHKKGQPEEVQKKCSHQAMKFQRAITGASLAEIMAKRNQKSEVHKAECNRMALTSANFTSDLMQIHMTNIEISDTYESKAQCRLFEGSNTMDEEKKGGACQVQLQEAALPELQGQREPQQEHMVQDNRPRQWRQLTRPKQQAPHLPEPQAAPVLGQLESSLTFSSFPPHMRSLLHGCNFLDHSENSLQHISSQHSTPYLEHSRNNSHLQLSTNKTENESGSAPLSEDDEKDDELKLKDIFTYSSQPRSAPHGKVQSTSSEGFMWTVDIKEHGKQENADKMEDDFHGNYSSEEKGFKLKAPSCRKQNQSNIKACEKPEELPKRQLKDDLLNRITRQLSGARTSSRNSEASLVSHISHSSMSVSSERTIKTASSEQTIKGTSFPALSKIDKEKIHCSITPVQSRSPTRIDAPDSTSGMIKLKDGQASQSRTSMVKRSLKEIPKEDPRLTTETCEYNWLNYQPKDMSESDEARMLASLRRQQLEEMEDDGKINHLNAVQLGYCVYGDDSMSTSSDDTSIWSTQHTGPPVNQGHHYQNEMLLTLSQKKMNPLLLSNPRDWGNIYSPPIILPSEQLKDLKNTLSPEQPAVLQDLGNDTASNTEDQDEVLDLLYDPCLNCYFDPKTGKYYELA
ncbi:uncharacterized protein C3orf67 homolog [Carcharodon carcharias]|uniref:uncharacterized protein C3orf67 homolog n=1 Tax=Carcharodon carcharias TaxID=13397 RepID=UPI001B7ED741|nr:uncharacterized protein C3orf67 homolog [Carcharodon carcharias]